jgi:transcriptional regulator with XRE-family HTH domain
MIDKAQTAGALDRFGRNAVELRRRSGLSQLDASLRAGLHRTEISMVERGLRVPRLDTILRIAAATDADPSELLEGLVWDLERNRLWDARPSPGRYEILVGGNTVTREVGGWKKVGG